MKSNNNNSENQAFTSVFTASARPSNRLYFKGAEMAKNSADKQNMGDDSIPFQGIPPNSAAGAAPKKKTRLTRAQLEKLEERLSARDLSVLQALRKYRFLTSDQIGRLFFANCSTKTSQTRNQNLLLQRLSEHGLIRPLARRIGGYQGGSSVQIWYLTEAGYRLLTLNTPGEHKRKRFSEPSPLFLAHTLTIAECVVQLTLICRNSHDLSLEAVDTEPSCWRKYKTDGRVCYLKPDVFVVTSYEKYEDSWFIEIDLSTESSSQIIDKCNTYLEYFYTGIEQKETGVFPIVTWVVKNKARKEKIRQYIRENIKGQPKMFLVITPDELEKMIRQYIGNGELC